MLPTLPAELLLSIASYFDSHTDTLRLASCCRAFYPLLLPKVFTSLDLIKHRNGHLSHLVHTLSSRPELAQEVRTFRVSYGWRPTSGVRYERQVILPVLKSALGPADDLSAWDWELQNREKNDAWNVLLLGLLPNLENLVLQIYEFSNHTLEWMAQIADEEGSALSKLRNLTVLCSEVDGGLSSSHFLPILRLPSLRRFYGHVICDGGTSDDDYAEDEAFNAASYVPKNLRYSNITHIHLKSSCSRRGFADLIGAPKSLESFILEHSDNPNSADQEGMYVSRYCPPLNRHQKTLRKLTLTDECTNYYTAHQSHDYGYVGSFAGFSALKELRLQLSHLLDCDRGWSDRNKTSGREFSDVLPLSLERLILDGLETQHTTGLVEAFKDLFLGQKYGCPNLAYLEVKGNWMHTHQSTEESNAKPRPLPAMLEQFADFKAELEPLCSAVGVSFHLRDLHIEYIIEQNRSYIL
ncbi:uncharacterized protein N7473_004492 [Penicillium subrubescens]|uniref:Leucine-rich repeat domain-containing protein n=1 Tax=Penicillium subrubescens TaxID=1316194 RepID=A0A1Q5TPR3_9EURO|nr:uncharacterized protein N7473_004492 [Penicillium subrubescens]KAJ5900422.1 hypothetical protein N7473_004492 [Penicillium subrubescens]OKP02202.1 hypothetical protein PENSUB_7185 [Penicillium subrubescens]